MNKKEIFEQIKKKESYLCIGLDTDLNKIPKHLLKEKDPIFEFNKIIIDSTYKYCVAYKPNTAFYECYGTKGWESLQRTFEYIPKEIFTIADAKRADIGNTSSMYAQAFFNKELSGISCDAVTVAPYMGEDSVKPFLNYPNKWAIILALTSNEGSKDFQQLIIKEDIKLYEKVITTIQEWGNSEQIMLVIGATKSTFIKEIRKLAPDYFFLVPGVGAQGGNLEEISKFGFNKECGLLVNSSRNIIYASDSVHFEQEVTKAAYNLKIEMQSYLDRLL
jgi:orotidine-5'-phosphate decarboxylase